MYLPRCRIAKHVLLQDSTCVLNNADEHTTTLLQALHHAHKHHHRSHSLPRDNPSDHRHNRHPPPYLPKQTSSNHVPPHPKHYHQLPPNFTYPPSKHAPRSYSTTVHHSHNVPPPTVRAHHIYTYVPMKITISTSTPNRPVICSIPALLPNRAPHLQPPIAHSPLPTRCSDSRPTKHPMTCVNFPQINRRSKRVLGI